MALFKGFTPKLKDAIDWFKGLSPEKQTSLIMGVFRDPEKLSKEEAEKVMPMLLEIASSLASHSKDDVTKKLVDFGIDDTLARVIVDKISTLTPTPLMCAQALKDLSDETFEKVINEIIKTFFLDWRRFDSNEISTKLGINVNVLRSAMMFLRDTIVWDYLRGHLGIETLRERLSKEYDFPSAKTDILTNILQNNRDELRLSLMFGTVQDISRDISTVSKSLEEILSSLKELIQILKKESKSPYVA
jgi:hypothetical protein